jgi:hypothetical protein
MWDAVTDSERRILVDEYVESVTVHEKHLEVKVRQAPSLWCRRAEIDTFRVEVGEEPQRDLRVHFGRNRRLMRGSAS